MKKVITRIFALVMVTALVIVGIAYASAKGSSDSSEYYVNDLANVFSNEEKTKMLEVSTHMAEEYSIDFIIATIDTLGNSNISQYAEKYFETGNVGTLILFEKDNNEVHIECSEHLKELVDIEEFAKLIEEYAVPAFGKGEYGSGVIELQTWLINYIMSDSYKVLVQEKVIVTEPEPAETSAEEKVDDRVTVTSTTTDSNITSETSNIFENPAVLCVLLVLIALLLIRSYIWYHTIREGKAHVR